MKLQELGLKQKPQTHYFQGGYVSFSTRDSYLNYSVTRVTKINKAEFTSGVIMNKEHLQKLLNVKSIAEVLQI